MASANISILATTSIHSYATQDTSYLWSNLLDGDTDTNGRSAIGNPANQWIIIDLGMSWPLTGFRLWNSSFADPDVATRTFKIEISNSGVGDGDFSEAVPETRIPYQDPGLPPDWGRVVGSRIRTIPLVYARYVKLYLLTNLNDPLNIAASDFEIYAANFVKDTVTIASNAQIFLGTETQTITSDAFVNLPTFTDHVDITSNAEITDTRSDRLSNAWIVDSLIASDATIVAPSTVTITSDAYIYRSGSFVKDLLLFGKANSVISFKNVMVFTTDISSSDEVVVNDEVIGPILDMTTVSPPLGYNNYDWKYDWVVRTYNKCQYKFEIRTADDLLELSAEPFSEIELNSQIYKGQVSRYHQWRCHVWASGSGDFELHQFTIKGYIDYPANPIYRTLYNKPFITTSRVKEPSDVFTTQLYEPPLDAKWWNGPYLPGDLNNDWNISLYDTLFFADILAGVTSELVVPSPGFNARADWDGDGSATAADLVQMNTYLFWAAGPPPLRYEEPS